MNSNTATVTGLSGATVSQYPVSQYPVGPYPMAAHPVLRILVSFPIACFCCALATDIAYVVTADMLWADFSDWLLAAGIIIGGVAAIVGCFALLARRRARARLGAQPASPWRAWPLAIGSLVVLVVEFFNNLVHSRDAWTSVMPEGLVLSAVGVVVIVITAWLGGVRGARRARPVSYAGARP